MELFAIIFFGVTLIFVAYCFGRAFWSLFDHIEWGENSYPSYDAKIVDIRTEKVQYLKNGMKYKTTIYFSDGFMFTTHKTNRENGFFTYNISIDKKMLNEIINEAIRLHEKEVSKKINRVNK